MANPQAHHHAAGLSPHPATADQRDHHHPQEFLADPVIAVTELMRVSEQIASRTFQPLETYLAAALLYLAVNLVLARFSAHLERRMSGGLATE